MTAARATRRCFPWLVVPDAAQRVFAQLRLLLAARRRHLRHMPVLLASPLAHRLGLLKFGQPGLGLPAVQRLWQRHRVDPYVLPVSLGEHRVRHARRGEHRPEHTRAMLVETLREVLGMGKKV